MQSSTVGPDTVDLVHKRDRVGMELDDSDRCYMSGTTVDMRLSSGDVL